MNSLIGISWNMIIIIIIIIFLLSKQTVTNKSHKSRKKLNRRIKKGIAHSRYICDVYSFIACMSIEVI
jgi:hypothetical protein